MRRTTKLALLFAISAPFLFVLWLVLVGTFAGPEMLIGAAAALVAAFGLCVVQRAEPTHFGPRISDIAQLIYVPWLIVQDTYQVTLVALCDLLGGRKAVSAFRVASFHAGESHDPRATARRVLATGATTMSPNFMVLGINSRQDELLFHQIKKTPVPQMTKNLGADA